MNAIAQWKNFTNIILPDWVTAEQDKLQSQGYVSDEDRMALVLQCAEQNARLQAGAPLAAAVFSSNGELISIGVDSPGIGGHEMSAALIIASNLMGSDKFRSSGAWELFSLAPPCLTCQGNIYSERPKRFVHAVSHGELRSVLHLPDTPFPSEIWERQLKERGIEVKQMMNRKALEILQSGGQR